MKKLATLIVVTVAGVTGVLAQGFLAGQNFSTSPLTAVNQGGTSNIVGAAGSILAPGSTIVTLWVATNGAPKSALVQVAQGTNSTASIGLAIGTFNLGNPLTLAAPWDGSFQIELLYRAWSISTGATQWNPNWSDPLLRPTTGFAGESAMLTAFTLQTGGNPAPATFGAGLLTGLVLTQGTIPEPSTLVLAGLGLASLLALRRRK